MKITFIKLLRCAFLLVVLLLAACGGGGGYGGGGMPPAGGGMLTYTIGGNVTGLGSGQQVTLDNNGANQLSVAANGTFTFTTPVALNSSYAVTVGTQPAGQICTVSNGSGTGVMANITNVSVTCSANTYTISGSVTGLGSGQQVTLDNNGANPLTVTANGTFIFTTPVAYNSSYAITVGTQPAGQTCTVANGSGSGVTANITNVSVTCSANTYTISGSVTGLGSGQQVTLDNNGANPLSVAANGTFTFTTPVAYNGSYAVTVGTQPTTQTCTVSNGSGTNVTANVTNVNVACSTNTYTISGSVTGLASGQQVTLLNNAADPTTVTTNSNFTFSTPVAYSGSYAVTVGTQPTTQTCTVSNGSGTNVTANVSNVQVNCGGGVGGVVTVLYSFTGGTDGYRPLAGLIQDSAGNLYGTTAGGGAAGGGTVFKITSAGVETVLHSFTGGTDGASPEAGLIQDSAGNLYGTTTTGGGE